MHTPPRLVVMGVSGCGKSTVGERLAASLGVRFVEGDALHPTRNVQRMAAGIPLTDDDRREWLQAIAGVMRSEVTAGRGFVVACSALKRTYRDRLRDDGAADLCFVHLHGERAVLEQRMAARTGHYMPASLLQSQLDTLEPPTDDEAAITVDIDAPPQDIVAEALRRLKEATP
jgi:gluconokinase